MLNDATRNPLPPTADCGVSGTFTAGDEMLCYNLPAMNLRTIQPHDCANGDGIGHAVDRIGATASFLCALHCAALPFVFALLPALGLEFLADHTFERWFIAFATALSLTMLVRGYLRHRTPHALGLLLPSLVLLWLGGFAFDVETSAALHAVLVALGGSGVAAAHLVNLRLAHAHEVCCSNAIV